MSDLYPTTNELREEIFEKGKSNMNCPKCNASPLSQGSDRCDDTWKCGTQYASGPVGYIKQSPQCRIIQLENAIKNHRSQKADDRCIFDDDVLYETLGDGIKCDRRVGSQCEMLKNCERFIKNRTEEGGWKTYAELEEQNKDLAMDLDLTKELYDLLLVKYNQTKDELATEKYLRKSDRDWADFKPGDMK